MSLKREIFVNFLPQRFMTKYGIVLTYSVTFVSQKILTCFQCEDDTGGYYDPCVPILFDNGVKDKDHTFLNPILCRVCYLSLCLFYYFYPVTHIALIVLLI